MMPTSLPQGTIVAASGQESASFPLGLLADPSAQFAQAGDFASVIGQVQQQSELSLSPCPAFDTAKVKSLANDVTAVDEAVEASKITEPQAFLLHLSDSIDVNTRLMPAALRTQPLSLLAPITKSLDGIAIADSELAIIDPALIGFSPSPLAQNMLARQANESAVVSAQATDVTAKVAPSQDGTPPREDNTLDNASWLGVNLKADGNDVKSAPRLPTLDLAAKEVIDEWLATPAKTLAKDLGDERLIKEGVAQAQGAANHAGQMAEQVAAEQSVSSRGVEQGNAAKLASQMQGQSADLSVLATFATPSLAQANINDEFVPKDDLNGQEPLTDAVLSHDEKQGVDLVNHARQFSHQHGMSPSLSGLANAGPSRANERSPSLADANITLLSSIRSSEQVHAKSRDVGLMSATNMTQTALPSSDGAASEALTDVPVVKESGLASGALAEKEEPHTKPLAPSLSVLAKDEISLISAEKALLTPSAYRSLNLVLADDEGRASDEMKFALKKQNGVAGKAAHESVPLFAIDTAKSPEPMQVNVRAKLASPLNLASPDAANHLYDKVNVLVNGRLQQANIELNPLGLGKLQIQIQLNSEQQTSVQFIVQHQQTREMLEQHLPRLRELLGQQGLQLVASQVQASVLQSSSQQLPPPHTSQWAGDPSFTPFNGQGQNQGHGQQTHGQPGLREENVGSPWLAQAEDEGGNSAAITPATSCEGIDFYA